MIVDITRTIRLSLCPDATTCVLLLGATTAHAQSFNAIVRYGWDRSISNGVELHKATYREHRSQFSLPSQLACAARVKATEVLKAAKTAVKAAAKLNKERAEKAKRHGKPAPQPRVISCPYSSFSPIRYDVRSYKIRFNKSEVSLLTLSGRVFIPFLLPAYYTDLATWSIGSADLIRDRKGRWSLHVSVSKEVDPVAPTGEVVGIDLGIVKPATDSNGKHYGKDRWKEIEQRTLTLRRALQVKGTKSAKRHLMRLRGRTGRFHRDCDHVVSKQIVSSVCPGATLVFEDLTGILDRVKVRRAHRQRLHFWSFDQLLTFTQYKAAARGVSVVNVDARYTSQKCSRCAHVSRSNRTTQADFKCCDCGFVANADVNAAINIRANYIKSQGLPINQPIVSSVSHSCASGTNRQL